MAFKSVSAKRFSTCLRLSSGCSQIRHRLAGVILKKHGIHISIAASQYTVWFSQHYPNINHKTKLEHLLCVHVRGESTQLLLSYTSEQHSFKSCMSVKKHDARSALSFSNPCAPYDVCRQR